MNSEAIRYFRSPGISPRLPLPLPRSFDHGRHATRREDMIHPPTGRTLRHSLFAAGIAPGAVVTVLGPAAARECPPDKRGPHLTQKNATPPQGVRDTPPAAVHPPA